MEKASTPWTATESLDGSLPAIEGRYPSTGNPFTVAIFRWKADRDLALAAPELREALKLIADRLGDIKRRPDEGVTIYVPPDDIDRIRAALRAPEALS